MTTCRTNSRKSALSSTNRLQRQAHKLARNPGRKLVHDQALNKVQALAAVRDAINRNDTDAMKRTYDDLQNKFQEVSAELYKQASAAGAQAGPQPGPEAGARPGAEQGAGAGARGAGNGDVVDAEFEVVDEDKKK